jgi:hypothetical protein
MAALVESARAVTARPGVSPVELDCMLGPVELDCMLLSIDLYARLMKGKRVSGLHCVCVKFVAWSCWEPLHLSIAVFVSQAKSRE